MGGQIAHFTKKGLQDIQLTMNSLANIWDEFMVKSIPGLVANVVAVLPDVKRQRLCKEVNLSVWESGQTAYEWYKESPGHREILKRHTSGKLQTFGNLLASLELAEPTRYQSRCQHCARFVESPELGKIS